MAREETRNNFTRPRGWSAVTRKIGGHGDMKKLGPGPKPEPSDFVPLTPATAAVVVLPSSSSSANAQSFSSVLLGSPEPSQAVAISRLKSRHIWADESLIVDLFQAFDLNEAKTSEYLASISCNEDGNENEVICSPSNGQHNSAISRLKALHSWAEESLIEDLLKASDMDEARASEYLVSISGTEFGNSSNSAQSENLGSELQSGCQGISIPPEPEWEEDDVYLQSRRDAIRQSRASSKHAAGAYKAFIRGDYDRAKFLSKLANEERIEAERLHSEAAKVIFSARNSEDQSDLWQLDLHGLHVGEAIDVLRKRFLEIENLQSSEFGDVEGNSSSCSNLRSGRPSNTKVNLPFGQGLTVITGVGNHSRGGSSLPSAVKSFLIHNRYKFEESRPGMLVVYPKFQLLKNK